MLFSNQNITHQIQFLQSIHSIPVIAYRRAAMRPTTIKRPVAFCVDAAPVKAMAEVAAGYLPVPVAAPVL
jgi:hypothetical protein